nr:substrate-binding domain-containing protein [Noviherbaspirillum denitrificans]
MAGSLQISTGFVIAQHLLPPTLAAFRSQYPAIEVEIQTAREQVDLARRDADIAIRFATRVPDYLVGRKLGNIRFRIYAWNDAPFLLPSDKGSVTRSIDYLVGAYPWICLGRDARERPYDRWMHKHVPDSSVVMRADHFPTSLALLRAGLGVALLPEFMAYGMNDLVALSAPIDELESPLWILTHPDLRNTARVRAFTQVVGAALENLLSKL